MDALLSNPAVQGGIAPFLVALLIASLFLKMRIIAALALVAGVITTVMLTTGIQLSPLTSTRKIVLLIIIIPVVSLLLDLFKVEIGPKVMGAFYALGIACILWVLWPVISRNPIAEMLIPILGYAVYVAWMIGLFLRLSELPRISAATASTGVGFGIGITALVGSSALLGQMGLAFGAAAAAYLLTQVFDRNDEPAGFTFSLTSAFIAALLLPAAVVYAKVPWIALPLIGMVPLLAFYPFDEDDRIIGNLMGILLVMAIPIAAAIYFTWQKAGAPIM